MRFDPAFDPRETAEKLLKGYHPFPFREPRRSLWDLMLEANGSLDLPALAFRQRELTPALAFHRVSVTSERKPETPPILQPTIHLHWDAAFFP